MVDKLKNPNCLIDAEALASHISIVTTKSGQNKPANQSGTTSSNSNKGKVSSQSQLKESTNKSQTSDKISGTSMSQTQTNAISSET